MKKQLMPILSALLLSLACVLCGCSGDDGEGKKKPEDPFEETDDPDSVTESVGLEYEPNESGDGYIVVGMGTCTDNDVVIPTFHEGKLVTGIGESAFKDCTNLTSISIPNSITNVFASSFEGCTHLTSINLTDATTMHNALGEWIIDTHATCLSEGSKYRECLDEGCGSYFVEPIPKKEHTPGDWITDTPAGCLVDGSRHKECTVAGCGVILETAPITASGHTASDWITDTPAGCLVDGSRHKECTVASCGAILETAPITASGHTASDWITDAPAGCLTEGSKHKECTVPGCGALVETAPIPETGHSMSGNHCPACGYTQESAGLRFVSNGDDTCYVSGLGSCSDEHISIPSVSPEGLTVTGIGNNAFENITTIKSVTIPGSVLTIGDKAFSKCSSLKRVVFSEGVQSIGEYAFWACGLSSLEIPASMISIGHDAFYQCSGIKSITFSENSQLRTIGNAAFHSCSGMKNIEVPNSVIGIGDSAFGRCSSLERISLPFVGCAPDSPQYGHFGAIFGAWSSTSNSNYVPASIKTVVITCGERINDRAFYGCDKITAIVISDSITSIGVAAFGDSRTFSAVYYEGTASDWDNIEIGSENAKLVNSTRYYYSENEPTDEENLYWHYDEGGNPVAW